MTLRVLNEEERKSQLVRSYKRTKIQRVLEEFIRMECTAVELNWQELTYKNALTAYFCFVKSAKRFHFPVIVIKRGDRVFLAKEGWDNE